MKTCKTCGDELTSVGHLICPACAAALDDLVAKRTGLKAEVKAQVIEALKMSLWELQDWHRASLTWYDENGTAQTAESCACYTCQIVIPKVRAALEVLSAQIL